MFRSIKMCGPENISSVFKGYCRSVFDQDRGAGYWIWKFYLIRDALEKANDGDLVMYVDSGSKF